MRIRSGLTRGWVAAIAVALSLAAGTRASLADPGAKAIIADLYRINDRGIATQNLAAMMLPVSRSIEVTGVGLKRPAHYAEILRGSEHFAKTTQDGYRVMESSKTNIESISVAGNTATVLANNTREYYIQDAAMDTVGAVYTSRFRDTWRKEARGWRQIRGVILSSKETPHTFPIGLNNSVIAGMHRQNMMMKNFGDRVNQSYCMHSPALADAGYATAVAACHP